MNILAGYIGFVGSNIHAAASFDLLCSSKNIQEAYGKRPQLLVYAGVRAEKYLAAHEPQKDLAHILQAEENIAQIQPEKLVLISTIDVYGTAQHFDETSQIDAAKLKPYGLHRYQLEQWVREHYPDALIIRLPALYGKNIRKNFIYDYMNRIPSMLHEDKMEQLEAASPGLKACYERQENGFYRLLPFTGTGKESIFRQKKALEQKFRKAGFSALHFTDSRSTFQFYGLSRLWGDIQTALREGLALFLPVTEPVRASEIYEYLSGETFVNETGTLACYDCRTRYAGLFGGRGGYLETKAEVLEHVREFVNGTMQKDDESGCVVPK